VGAAVGGVVGAAVSGLYTRLRDSGVDNKFMKEVSEKLEPGKTDLFIVYNGVLSETMLATLRDFDASVSYGALPAAATAALTEAYEASGEEIGSDMDVYTAEVTEADLVPTEIDLAPPVAVVVAETEAPADNLVAIDGIGPKISQALIAAGIRTFDDLHRTSDIHLRETLTDAKIVIPTSLPTWPRQAGLAAAGDWKGLYSYNAKRKLDSAKK
jgi:predicted flap endonuclease-1-like 5' DNA nuclease